MELNEAQAEALKEVERILGEQFEEFVCIAFSDEVNDERDYIYAFTGKGTLHQKMGLLDYAKIRFKNMVAPGEEEES